MKKTKNYKVIKEFATWQIGILVAALIITYLAHLYINDLGIVIAGVVAIAVIVMLVSIALVSEVAEKIAGAAGTTSITGIIALGILLLKAKKIIIISPMVYDIFLLLVVIVLAAVIIAMITVIATTENLKTDKWKIFLSYSIQIVVVGTFAYFTL